MSCLLIPFKLDSEVVEIQQRDRTLRKHDLEWRVEQMAIPSVLQSQDAFEKYQQFQAEAAGTYESVIGNLRAKINDLKAREKRVGRPTKGEVEYRNRTIADLETYIVQFEYKRMECMRNAGVPIFTIAAMARKTVEEVEEGIRIAQYESIPDDLRAAAIKENEGR